MELLKAIISIPIAVILGFGILSLYAYIGYLVYSYISKPIFVYFWNLLN